METAVSVARVGADLRGRESHRRIGPAATDRRVHILNGFARGYAGGSCDGAFSMKWMPAGEARYSVGGHEHRLAGERVLILEPDQPYEVEFLGRGHSESFCLFFSRALRCEAQPLSQAADIVFRPPPGFGNRLHRLRASLSDLEQEPDLLEGAVLSVLAEATDLAAEHRQIAQLIPGRRPETCRRLLGQLQHCREMIEDHRGRPPSLSTLAAAAGFSKFHCLRLFKAAYGVGPAAYAERCRLNRASALLQQTTLPIDRIADEAGYDSQSAFAKAFRRRFGLAPRAFRIAAK
jgi:AraC-like DNA-binding protein